MNAIVVVALLPILGYALVHTYRDLRRRHWFLAAWGSAIVLFAVWVIERLTTAAGY